MNIVYIPEEQLIDNEENFYHIDDNEVIYLARSIEALDGIAVPLIVKPLDSMHYKIIAGHKRKKAVQLLLSEGKEQYRNLPCTEKNLHDGQEQDSYEKAVEMLTLMLINSSARQHFTPYEKMKEVENLEWILKNTDSCLNVRNAAAELLNMSKSEVGRYQKISRNLSEEMKPFFAEGKIKTQTADKLASLSPAQQRLAEKVIKVQGSIKASEVDMISQRADSSSKNKLVFEMKPIEEKEQLQTEDDFQVVEESERMEEQEALDKLSEEIPESNDILLDVYEEKTFERIQKGIQTHHILYKARKYSHWKVGTQIRILSSVSGRKIQVEILYINRNHALLKETAMVIIFRKVR